MLLPKQRENQHEKDAAIYSPIVASGTPDDILSEPKDVYCMSMLKNVLKIKIILFLTKLWPIP
jgi:hypothetical protein